MRKIAFLCVTCMLILVGITPDSHAAKTKKKPVNEVTRFVMGVVNNLGDEENDRKRSVAKINRLGKKALPGLIEALELEEDRVRQNAVYLLGRITLKTDKVIDALVEAIGDNDHVHPEAINSLQQIGMRALPSFMESLRSKDDDVRESAVFALGRMRMDSPEVETMLIRMLEKGGRAERGTSAFALGEIRFNSDTAIEALAIALSDKDNRVRINASQSLEKYGRRAKPAVPELGAALSDPSVWVRRNASRALKNIGKDSHKATQALAQALQDPNQWVRINAVDTLYAIGYRAKDAQPALEKALDDQNILVRDGAQRTLRKIKAEAKKRKKKKRRT